MEIKFEQTANYSVGKDKKLGVVLHFTLGGFLSATGWLKDSNRPNRTSAHYVIGRNEGEIVQLVKDEDVAWHAGVISNPTDRFKKIALKNLDGTYTNPNKYLIGIELATGYDMNGNGKVDPTEYTITEWQYKALQAILTRLNYKDDYILVHKDIADYKEDVNAIRTEILKRMSPSPVNSKDIISKRIGEIKQKLVELETLINN